MPSVKLRFLLGSLILLLVDILWVTSSEITKYLYRGLSFDKPFFTAYVKSVMFAVYLAGFIFCDNWYANYTSIPNRSIDDLFGGDHDDEEDERNLTLDQDDDDDEEGEEEEEEDEEIDVDSSNEEINLRDSPSKNELQTRQNINCNPCDLEPVGDESTFTSIPLKKIALKPASAYIGESIWVPMKRCSDTSSLSGKSSEDEELTTSFEGDVTMETSSLSSLDSSIPNSADSSAKKSSKDFDNFSQSINVRKKSKQSQKKASKKLENNANSLNNPKPKKHRKRAVRFSKLIEVRQLTQKHAEEHFLSRLSYSAFTRLLYNRNQQAQQKHAGTSNGTSGSAFSSYVFKGGQLGTKDTAMLAFYFTAIWFTANMSFHMGLRYSEAGLVNVLSSTTPLFTLLLGIIFPSGSSTDAISLTKLLGVLLCISSVALLSTTEPLSPGASSTPSRNAHLSMDGHSVPLGSLWSLGGAFFYAVYIVLMRYNVPHDSMLNFPMFFGFIGLFSAFIMWPILFLLHFTQLEQFEWPSQGQWLLLLVNGLCGTVVSELLWLLGSFMTSSLVGTIAISFTIPLAVSFDIIYKEVQYPRLFFLGTIPMLISFVTIIIVSQYDRWDPLLVFLERCVRFARFSKPRRQTLAGDGDGDGGGAALAACMNATNLLMERQEDGQDDGVREGDKTTQEENDSPPLTPAANRRFENGSRSLSPISPTVSFKKRMVESTVPSLSTSSVKLYNFGSVMVTDNEDEDGELSQSLIDADGGGAYA